MVNPTSNYMTRVQQQYSYDYNKMRSTTSQYNQAGVQKTSEPDRSGYVNSDALETLSGIQNSANRLLDTLSDNSRSNVFREMQAVSSDNAYVAVNESSRPGAVAESRVEVEQIARTQVNEGFDREAQEQTAATAGTNRFEIEQNGRTYSYEIQIEEGDTNEAVQQRVADAINQSGAGINASVQTDENGQSALRLESAETGAASAFSIRDTEGGTAIAATGAATVERAAQDAVYSVNGGEARASASNDVNLANGVNVTLLQATGEGGVTISSRTDMREQREAFREMVGDINRLLSSADRAGTVGSRLESDLNGLLRGYGRSLENVGVSFDGDRLSIDRDRLNQGIQDGSLQRLMATGIGQGGNSGFAYSLSRIAENAAGTSRNTSGVRGENDYRYSTDYNWSQDRGMYVRNENQRYTSGNVQDSGRGINWQRWQDSVSQANAPWEDAWQEAQDSIDNWSTRWQNAMDSYRSNTNNYAYMYNSPGAIMNLYL